MKTFSIPPLFDHHSHYSMYAALSAMPALTDITDHGLASNIIRSSIKSPVTIIPGWNSSRFNLTPRDLGDKHPVIVLNLSLHGMVMNHPAEEYLSRDYNDIVQKHADPLWAEKNLARILTMMVRLAPSSAQDMDSFGIFLQKTGIGAMEDMLLPDAKWLAFADGFPIPVEFWADKSVFTALTSSEKAKVKGVKLFTDGALGTRTAALSAPYLSGERGMLLMENDSFTAELHGCMQQGIPLAIHAIGNMAVDQVVQTVSLLRKESGCGGPVRIEHAQFITKDSACTARDAGITLSMQPNFSDDSVMYTDRLPAGYAAMNNPFRMLIDYAGFVPGRDLVFGSDGMPHGMKPALQSALFPPFPGQVLTIPEFQAGYCMPGADAEWDVKIEGTRVTIIPYTSLYNGP